MLPVLLAVVFGTSGCQVMRRAEECQELSRVLKRAEPELERTPIQDNPSERDLRTRARLYGQLGQALQKMNLKGKRVSAEADVLVKEILVLEIELNRAAEVISERALFLEEQQKSRPESARTEAAPVPKETEEQSSKTATAPTSRDGKISVARGAVPSKRAPVPRTSQQKELAFAQSYNRARRAARMAGQQVTDSVERLQKLCH